MSVFSVKKFAKHFTLAGIILLVIIAAIINLFNDFHPSAERLDTLLSHEIYVWQRHWDEMLSKSLQKATEQVSAFSVLAAEISWESGRPNVIRVPINYSTLKATEKPIGFALRIGPYAGPFDKQDEMATYIARIAGSLVEDARKAGIELKELQIDFDCAESKLDGYRKWVEVLREEIHPISLTITALPCWLKHKAFSRLAEATDGYVLQVHSLERPKSMESEIILCDCTAASLWVEQAGRINIPFRVALPTYGYIIAFDQKGSFIGLSAEGPSQVWVEGMQLRVASAEPIEIAKLVQSWQQDRPYNMQGLIWYRLPVESDKLNWKWTTLSAILAGRIPEESLRVEVEYPKPELAEIILVNDGEIDQSAKLSIKIECQQQEVVASDGLNGYIITKASPTSTCLEYHGENILSTIRAGDRWKIGWIRFKHEMEIKAHVSTLKP